MNYRQLVEADIALKENHAVRANYCSRINAARRAQLINPLDSLA